jgi:HlyD family secretion protein
MLIDDSNPQPPKTGAIPARPSGKFSSLFRLGLPIATIVILMLWILGVFRSGVIEGGKAKVAQPAAAGRATYRVTAETLPATREAVGAVQAERIATITSRVMASILQMRVTAGQRVTRGETLVTLDDRDLRRRVDQSQEAVASVQATLAQAESDYNRDKPLFEQKVITPFDFEHDQTNLKAAQANLKRLQQAQREAMVNLSYATIVSPFSGVVVDKLANEGDMAAPGRPLLTLYEQGRLWLEANVPEEQMRTIHLHGFMRVRIDAAQREIQGPVAEIVPSADPTSRTEVVRVRLPGAQDLVPGMFGRLMIPAAPETVVAIPDSAVIRAGQLTLVDVVRGGAVERRAVQLGHLVNHRYEVLSGLAPGETILLSRAHSSTPDAAPARKTL